MTGTHQPDPASEIGAFDVCKHCGQPITEHWQTRVWVTMSSGNPECYKREAMAS